MVIGDTLHYQRLRIRVQIQNTLDEFIVLVIGVCAGWKMRGSGLVRLLVDRRVEGDELDGLIMRMNPRGQVFVD